MRLGVGICALNECHGLPRLLSRLTSVRDGEDRASDVVVADGGSRDGTQAVAVAGGARLLETGRGRGVQLGAAASALMDEGAEVMLFLHADSIPRIGAIAALRAAFEEGTLGAASMAQVIGDTGRSFRLIERAANARARRGMVYGDSGLAVRADLYAKVGGFKPLPLFEDVDFSKRLRQETRIVHVQNAPLVISSRRWRQEGVLRSSVRNWILRGLYECGVPPQTLQRLYRPFSSASKAPTTQP